MSHEHQWVDVTTTYEDQPGTVMACTECALIHRTGQQRPNLSEAWTDFLLALAESLRLPKVLDWIARKSA